MVPERTLGVCHLIQYDKKLSACTGEGGHVDFAPNGEEEDRILAVLRKDHGRISYERSSIRPGLVNLYKELLKSMEEFQ